MTPLPAEYRSALLAAAAAVLLALAATLIALVRRRRANAERRATHSRAGYPIVRHDTHQEQATAVAADPLRAKAVAAHVERCVGPVDHVWRDTAPQHVHVDVLHVGPAAGRPFHALVTSGMSDRPMLVPPQMQDHALVELAALLPSEWPLDEEALADPEVVWPLACLRFLARFPHAYQTWLGYGHTIPNGDPPQPFAPSAGFDTMLLLPGVSLGEEFLELLIPGRPVTRFYCLYPLYAEEAKLKLAKGTDALIARFQKQGVSDVVQVDRPNVG